MKIAIITDAWYPQINGVVRTLTKTVEGLKARGHDVIMVTPETFRTVPCPTYPEIRLSIFPGKRVSAQLRAFGPDCLHIATEGRLAWRRALLQDATNWLSPLHITRAFLNM